MVVAQLVERSFLTPEVHKLNPVICTTYIEQYLLSTVLKRRKIKEKDAGNGPLKINVERQPHLRKERTQIFSYYT